MNAWDRLPRAIKILVFFSPELGACVWIWTGPAAFQAALLSLARPVFSACSRCLESEQFLLSASLLALFMIAHGLRLMVFRLVGRPLMRGHRFSPRDALGTALILIAYTVFLAKALGSGSPAAVGLVTGLFDVLGATVTALALISLPILVYDLIPRNKES